MTSSPVSALLVRQKPFSPHTSQSVLPSPTPQGVLPHSTPQRVLSIHSTLQ
ncbi:hypothetical protein Hamer_G032237 [Homarus americanus]|uniref:Uncharacterized protein n=1 Tax=Homarus americanus TaxID=6706 RepID=A0A8J5K1R4_HOMAM|nr:hypothetical protein Hamer_G032237 [Homarus americanus]